MYSHPALLAYCGLDGVHFILSSTMTHTPAFAVAPVMQNHGRNGATSPGGIDHANHIARVNAPPFYGNTSCIELVTICFGANDAGSPAMTLGNYTANLAKAVQMHRSLGIPNVVLVTPPPLGKGNNMTLARLARYANAVKAVGHNLQVPVVDIHTAIQGLPDWQTNAMYKDGLHLGPAGNHAVFQAVNAVVKTLLHP